MWLYIVRCDYMISLHKEGDNIPDHLNISKDYPTLDNLQILITLQNIINDVVACTSIIISTNTFHIIPVYHTLSLYITKYN